MARAFDEAIGEEGPGLGVEELGDVFFDDEPCLAEAGPDLVAELLIAGVVGAAVVVEGDVEGGEIGEMRGPHLGDDFSFGAAFLAGPHHDGGAVGVVGAEEQGASTAKFLEANPDIGLDVFNEVANVDVAVGVREGGGDEEGSGHGGQYRQGRDERREESKGGKWGGKKKMRK